MDITIRKFEVGDLPDFLRLHEMVFDTWSAVNSAAVFEWKYERNPFSPELPVFLAEADGKIVSARGEVFLPMMIGGNEYWAMQGADVMTHPDYRGKGIYSRLRQHILEYYADSANPSPVMDFGFPEVGARSVSLSQGSYAIEKQEHHRFSSSTPDRMQDKSLAIRLGLPVFSVYRKVRNITPKPTVPEGVSIHLSEGISIPDLVEVYRRARPSKIHVNRCREFYEWRSQDPLNRFGTVLAEKRGKPLAGIVFSVSAHGYVKIRDGLPLDWSKVPDKIFSSLLHRLFSEYREYPILSVWNNTLPDQILKKHAFVSLSSIPLVTDPLCITFTPLHTEDPIVNGVDLSNKSNWQMAAITQDQ